MTEAKTGLIKYQTYTPEAAAADKKQADAASGDFWKPAAGNNTIRILPAPDSKHKVLVQTHNHFIEIPGNERAVGFNCPRLMLKKPCIVCVRADVLKAQSNKPDRDMGFQMSPKARNYVYLIDRSNPEAGPRCYAFGKKLFERLMEIRADQANGGDWADPSEDGFDLVLHKKGEKLTTEYNLSPARGSCALGHDQWIEDVLSLPDLQQYAGVPTTEEIEEKLGGFDLSTMGGAPGVSGGGRGRQQGGGRRGRNAEDDSNQS